MKRMALAVCAGMTVFGPLPTGAAGVNVTVHAIDATGIGPALGTIEATESAQGLTLTPRLGGLPPGPHGFHLHQNGDCGAKEQDGKPVAGLAAGGHFDPRSTGKHRGPLQEDGHLGDLPVLVAGPDGRAATPVVAPRLGLADLKGRAIVIHAGPDNYADEPKPLGGGGARIACGVVE